MSEQIRFTNKAIESIEPRASRFVVWDADRAGLGLRVTPRGAKTFVHFYRFDGRPRLHTIGSTKGVSLREALVAYAEATAKIERAKICRGRGETPAPELDPAGAKRAKRAETKAAVGVSDLWDEFVAKKGTAWRDATRKENARMWKAYLGDIAKKRARDVQPRDIKRLLDKVAENAPVQSNRLRGLLAQLFYFATEQFIVDVNPVKQVRRVAKEAPRQRALIDDSELRGFLAALAASGWNDAVRSALLLTLATGCRPGEAGGMRWCDVEEEAAIWTIPPELVKTGIEHIVPLSPVALEILAVRRAAGSAGVFVFGDLCRDVPLADGALSRALADRATLLAEHKVAPIRPHDLRRTCRSWLSKLRVPEEIAERVIGHVTKDRLLKTYDRHDYREEKRAALAAWSSTLIAMRAGDNVVAMKGKTAA